MSEQAQGTGSLQTTWEWNKKKEVEEKQTSFRTKYQPVLIFPKNSFLTGTPWMLFINSIQLITTILKHFHQIEIQNKIQNT